MTQPREREVPCGGLCGQMTPSASRYCDKCSSHSGDCDKCGDLVERRFRVLVPLDELNNDEQRWCAPCAAESGQHENLLVVGR